MRLAICLALMAGYVDAYGLLVLGTYVSLMSGNTTTAAAKVGQLDVIAAMPPLVAIVSFVLGSFAGTLVTRSRLDHTHRILFGLIAILLGVALLTGGAGLWRIVSIAVLSIGTGMMNHVLPRVGAEIVSLTYVTGTLNRIGSHLALAVRSIPVPDSKGPWDGHLYRAGIEARLWTAFASGAMISGIALPVWRGFTLVPAVVIMAALALFVRPR